MSQRQRWRQQDGGSLGEAAHHEARDLLHVIERVGEVNRQ
jgi:hypothetical protein